MKKLPKALALLPITAALLLAAAPAAAQDPGPVKTVRIAVVDPSSGNELTVVSPGQEIVIAPGEELTLRVFEPNPDRRHDRRPLAATFGFGPTETPLQIVSTSPERGEVIVRLNPTGAGQRWHVGYKLADRIQLADPSLQLGRVLVRVAGPGTASITGNQSYGTGFYSRSADDIVAAIYRGILLRDPDSGAAGARDDVARNGYDAVLRVAPGIANSEESRVRVYQDKGVSNSQRLEALYRELLGMRRSDVSREQWDSDLAQLERGNIAGVVDAIVRSQQFRTRFGF
jgi:hypothetical protein